MKSSSNLFSNTSSAKKMEFLKKEQQKTKENTKQTYSHLSKEDKKLVKEVKDRGDKITEK